MVERPIRFQKSTRFRSGSSIAFHFDVHSFPFSSSLDAMLFYEPRRLDGAQENRSYVTRTPRREPTFSGSVLSWIEFRPGIAFQPIPSLPFPHQPPARLHHVDSLFLSVSNFRQPKARQSEGGDRRARDGETP